MADKDKIRFLTGDVDNLADKTISRGQVYFAIDSTNDRGTILFDAPIDANTTRRIIMSGDHAVSADQAEIAEKARKDSQGNMITETYISQLRTDTTGLKLQYKIPDKPWSELSFNYLPLTGGHVTGVLQADSLTAGDLLVNGSARFVNTILGTIEKADQWTTARTFRLVDYDKANLSTKTTFIDGSQSSYDLFLPEVIKATLQGNADSATLAATATIANNVKGVAGTADAARHVWFSDSVTETARVYDDDFKYNPFTNTLTVANVTGNAGSADQAAKWSNKRTFQIADSINSHTGIGLAIDGSDSAYTLKLPETIAASIIGHASLDLPLTGGTMANGAIIKWADSNHWNSKGDGTSNAGVTFPYVAGGFEWAGQSDGISLKAIETASDNLELVLKFTDDGSNGLTIQNASGIGTARITAAGTATFSSVTATNFNGNATSADKWSTARNFKIADADNTHTGTLLAIDGSSTADYTLKLPSTIKATLQGNADSATYSNRLGVNSSTLYSDPGGLTWFDVHDSQGAAVNANDTPTNAWWYILRNRHRNTTNNYYTDIAIPFNHQSIYYKRITGELGSEILPDGGWVKVFDEKNYTDYTVKKDGTGATGTWNITATKANKATQDANSKDIDKNYLTNVFIKDDTNELWKTIGTTGESQYTTKIGTFAPLDSDGLINIKYIPQAALERVIIVTNKTARLALTTSQVQLGDVVKQDDTGQLYFVTDESKLDVEAGYMQFTAGRATEVPWSGIVSRPNVVGRSGDKNMITLDDTKTVFTYYRINSDGTNDTVNLAPAFLPLTGGHVTGVLQADSTTIGDLLVNGSARFVNTILGNIETADAWSTNRVFSVASSDNSNPGTGVAVNGSKDVRLLLPSTITASIVGHASLDLPLTGGTMTGNITIKKLTNATVTYNNRDANPSIAFQNSDASQCAALIYSDYDSYQAPDSLTLIGNQAGTYFIAPNIKATTGIYGNLTGNATSASIWATARTFSIGDSTNSHVGSGVSVNGSKDIRILLPETIKASIEGHASLDLPLTGGTLTGNLNFSGTPVIHWNDGTYQQRIAITDDSIANTNVFEFQQSSNSGFSFTTLMAIKDNGEVTATKFTGALNGNSTSADKWSTARNFKIADYNNSHTGDIISVDGSYNGDYILKMPENITVTKINDYILSNDSLDKYKYVQSLISTEYITDGEYCYATVTLNRAWKAYLDPIKIEAQYDNIDGIVYLYKDSFNEKWYAYVTDYNGSNIKGITASGGDNTVITFKLRHSTKTKHVTFSFYTNWPITNAVFNSTSDKTFTDISRCGLFVLTNITAENFYGVFNGNATSANKWLYKRNFKVSDYTNAHSGTAIARDGSETGDYNLLMPSTIDATTINMGGNIVFSNLQTGFRGLTGTMADNDCWRVGQNATASNAGVLEVATGDDGDEPIVVRQYTGVFTTLKRTLTLLDASGNTSLPGSLTVAGAITGSSTLTITGATTLNNTLVVAGAATLNSALAVTGATTLKSTLTTIGLAKFNATADSINSNDANAAVVSQGGVTVNKQLSAKSVRIDNNYNNQGCTMKFDETLNCVEFVFD